MSSTKQLAGRVGALRSWANTIDRSARTAPGRASGPASIEYHLARLDPDRFGAATTDQRLAAASAARQGYFAALALKSAQARARRRSDAA